jgi:hypothetical protein
MRRTKWDRLRIEKRDFAALLKGYPPPAPDPGPVQDQPLDQYPPRPSSRDAYRRVCLFCDIYLPSHEAAAAHLVASHGWTRPVAPLKGSAPRPGPLSQVARRPPRQGR